MRHAWSRMAGASLLMGIVAIGGAGTEARAQYSRRSPIVEAVQKTKAGIVTLKVTSKAPAGRKEVVGTGVIVDERGYVVTNRHVVANGDQIQVLLSDGTEIKGTVLFDDAAHDLAVVRIKTDKKLQALPFGPGSDLMVGETVIAVGHPFGYTNTVSTGIVSALGREIKMPGGEVLKHLIQTNASINPGNSGGPLLNINGELIGINVALREGAQGIAFALNADTVQQVLSKNLSAAKIASVRHGLQFKETVESEGKSRQHVVVEEVAAQTPAALAGLKKGDTLIRVATRSVANRFDVERALWDAKPGGQIEVVYLRAGSKTTVSLKLPKSRNDDGLASKKHDAVAPKLPVSPDLP
jgi:serine protease Do